MKFRCVLFRSCSPSSSRWRSAWSSDSGPPAKPPPSTPSTRCAMSEPMEQQLIQELGADRRGEVRAFECVTSTMDLAHALAQEGAPEGTLIWAKRSEER